MKQTTFGLVALLLVTGCAQTQGPVYAEAYRQALQQQQGTTAITPAMTDRFVEFYSHGAGTQAPAADELYGEPLYFSDTLLTTGDRAVALAHLERMRGAAESIRVDVIDRQVDGQDVYLIWQMRMTFEPVTRTVTSNTIGMTHLRFDDTGRIVLQQDFWDSAEGLYRHVPVLGGLIGLVRNRAGGDAD